MGEFMPPTAVIEMTGVGGRGNAIDDRANRPARVEISPEYLR